MSISVHVSVMLEPCKWTKRQNDGKNRRVKKMLGHIFMEDTVGKVISTSFQWFLVFKKVSASLFYTIQCSYIKSEEEER